MEDVCWPRSEERLVLGTYFSEKKVLKPWTSFVENFSLRTGFFLGFLQSRVPGTGTWEFLLSADFLSVSNGQSVSEVPAR